MMQKNEKPQGLFLNTAKANCSIHESGRMCYDCLKLSEAYVLDYQEVDKDSRVISQKYDFYVFNYHAVTMRWLDTAALKALPGFKATVVLEVLPNNPFVMCPKGDFDAYLVLDPTLQSIETNVYPFPRPLERATKEYRYVQKEVPQIGTFGFATAGKGFDKVIDAVNEEFDKAVIKINIPKGDYVSREAFEKMNNALKNHPSKLGVDVVITNDFFGKEELIEWCAQNTLNVFLYNRNMPGLSATTDQAITSGRPLAVSTNPTFRHLHTYLTPYPFKSLQASIDSSTEGVLKMRHDWSPENFALRFEKVLKDFDVSGTKKQDNVFTLAEKRPEPSRAGFAGISGSDFVPPVAMKVARRLFKKRSGQPVQNVESPEQVLEPFIHPALHSYSQFHEDLLLDLVLGKKEKGFYVDVGANHPRFNSNTARFYERGWTGINIEPNQKAFRRIQEVRANDTNLNMAVSENEGELTFYCLANDSTLSTLDYATAQRMASRLHLSIASSTVKTAPLQKILAQHANGATIDFMSVDAEGHDLSVLKSNDWQRFRPSLLMVESNNEFEAIRVFMDTQDYLHVFSNFYNALFMDKRTRDTAVLRNIRWQA